MTSRNPLVPREREGSRDGRQQSGPTLRDVQKQRERDIALSRVKRAERERDRDIERARMGKAMEHATMHGEDYLPGTQDTDPSGSARPIEQLPLEPQPPMTQSLSSPDRPHQAPTSDTPQDCCSTADRLVCGFLSYLSRSRGHSEAHPDVMELRPVPLQRAEGEEPYTIGFFQKHRTEYTRELDRFIRNQPGPDDRVAPFSGEIAALRTSDRIEELIRWVDGHAGIEPLLPTSRDRVRPPQEPRYSETLAAFRNAHTFLIQASEDASAITGLGVAIHEPRRMEHPAGYDLPDAIRDVRKTAGDFLRLLQERLFDIEVVGSGSIEEEVVDQ